MRGTDVAARIGGDEFILLLPDTDADSARRVAERIRLAVRSHPWPHRAITVSLGIASLAAGPETDGAEADVASRLLAEADRALYASKNRGRDQATHAGGAPAPAPAV
jgi:diguanylate cyclase (GGDEF)-like protein